MFSILASPFLKKVGEHYERGPIQVAASVLDFVAGSTAVVVGAFFLSTNPALGGTLLVAGGFQLGGGMTECIKLHLLSCKEGLAHKNITIAHKPCCS